MKVKREINFDDGKIIVTLEYDEKDFPTNFDAECFVAENIVY
jgi:hypothetical protein